MRNMNCRNMHGACENTVFLPWPMNMDCEFDTYHLASFTLPWNPMGHRGAPMAPPWEPRGEPPGLPWALMVHQWGPCGCHPGFHFLDTFLFLDTVGYVWIRISLDTFGYVWIRQPVFWIRFLDTRQFFFGYVWIRLDTFWIHLDTFGYSRARTLCERYANLLHGLDTNTQRYPNLCDFWIRSDKVRYCQRNSTFLNTHIQKKWL